MSRVMLFLGIAISVVPWYESVCAESETKSESVDATAPSSDAPDGAIQTVAAQQKLETIQWTVCEGKAESWVIGKESLSCQRPGGGWVRSQQLFSDFEIEFEYRLSPGANSGVAFRCPENGSPTFSGLEIQLIDDQSPKYSDLRPDQYSGSLYYHVAPSKRPALAAEQWHQCRIVCLGPKIQVYLAGQLVNDIDLDDAVPADSPLRARHLGFLAFQSHSNRVDFRKIHVTDRTETTPEGLKYLDITKGTGPLADQDSLITVDYTGWLVDGKVFDSSRERGKAVSVPLGKTIAGWKIGIPGMKVGGRRKLVIPPELAYGEKGVPGAIPPRATLVFEVELRGVEH